MPMRFALTTRRAMLALICATLVACGRAPAPAPAEFRDPATLIGATTRYDAARFEGLWQVRAAFPGDGDLRSVTFAPQGPTFVEMRESCDAAGLCTSRRVVWGATEEGPGRYLLRAAVGGAERALWVLWVDADFRTAVIGAPQGGYGWILDRNPRGGEDRIAAAREILDFNGYDLTALQER